MSSDLEDLQYWKNKYDEREEEFIKLKGEYDEFQGKEFDLNPILLTLIDFYEFDLGEVRANWWL